MALQHYYPSFVRLSQDELGSREAVEIAAQDVISQGCSVIIDRTNFDIRASFSSCFSIAHIISAIT